MVLQGTPEDSRNPIWGSWKRDPFHQSFATHSALFKGSQVKDFSITRRQGFKRPHLMMPELAHPPPETFPRTRSAAALKPNPPKPPSSPFQQTRPPPAPTPARAICKRIVLQLAPSLRGSEHRHSPDGSKLLGMARGSKKPHRRTWGTENLRALGVRGPTVLTRMLHQSSLPVSQSWRCSQSRRRSGQPHSWDAIREIESSPRMGFLCHEPRWTRLA